VDALAGEKSEPEGRKAFLEMLRKGSLEEMKITVSCGAGAGAGAGAALLTKCRVGACGVALLLLALPCF